MLLIKADEDLAALRVFAGRPEVSESIWGFHAQQAVEKLLKAILSHHGIVFPFTHRLHELADLMEDKGFPLGQEYEPLLSLTRYAVELRYSLLDAGDSSPLDREATLQNVDKLYHQIQSLL